MLAPRSSGEKSEARTPPPPAIEGPLHSFHSKVDWRLSLSNGRSSFVLIKKSRHNVSFHLLIRSSLAVLMPDADRRFRSKDGDDSRHDAAAAHRPRRKVRHRQAESITCSVT